MQRRKYISTIVGTVSGLGLAGCSTDRDASGNGGEGITDDEGNSTPIENPASQLNIEGFLTATEDDGSAYQAQVSAENPLDQSITADFSATISPATGEDMVSDSVEKTIPSGEQEEFRIDIVEWSSMGWEQLTSIYFRSFQFQISVNGNPVPEVCANADMVEPNAEGCEYTYGIYETFVEVEYDGNWQGSFGTESGQRTVSRNSASFGAPEGFDTSYVNVDDGANIVSANAQKQDNSNEELTIRIIHKDGVYAEQSTSAGYGVGQVSANIATGSPIRERDPVGSGDSATPSMTPEEFVEFLVNTVYDDPEGRYQNADHAAQQLGALIHPDRRSEVIPGRGLPSPEAMADDDVTFELVESPVVEAKSANSVVVRVVYTQSGETIGRFYELRIGPEDEWYIWDVGT
jgi:hypothetical protein